MLYKVTLTTKRTEETYIEADSTEEAQRLTTAYSRVIVSRPPLLSVEVLSITAEPASGVERHVQS